uniref:Uncharacterized protein n=1 Tax=Anguilla anguilla TaxID=7936 RepID=A0A0E9Q6M3_ANGAN
MDVFRFSSGLVHCSRIQKRTRTAEI